MRRQMIRIAIVALTAYVGTSCSDIAPLASTMQINEASLVAWKGAGCGIVVQSSTGQASQLISVSRVELPSALYQLGRRAAKADDGHELFRIEGAFNLGKFGHGETATAICAVPLDAPSGTGAAIAAHLPNLLRTGRYVSTRASSGQKPLEDLQREALLAVDVILSGASTPSTRKATLRANSLAGSPATLGSLIGSGDVPVRIAGITITASPYDHSWFFDMRRIGALWAGLMGFDADIYVAIITFDGGPHPCTIASEAWLVLDEIERDIDAMIQLLSANLGINRNFDSEVVCPHELMKPGQNCLDFYIAAATAAGIMAGDNRGPDPFATIKQSKVFVLDDFDNNALKIFISGSTVGIHIPFPGREPLYSRTWGFPPDSAGQIQRVDIESPDANTRIVTIQVANAACASWQAALTARFTYGEIPAGILKAGCPTIDARVTYQRDILGWRVSYVERDAFPAMSIWRKNSGGNLQLVNDTQARTDALGALFLFGIFKLKYEIEREKDDLMDEMNSSGCSLQ